MISFIVAVIDMICNIAIFYGLWKRTKPFYVNKSY
jgi:hypothetical protein